MKVRKVLIVEDDHDQAHLIELALSEENVSVSSALSGDEALKLLAIETFDLVLLDKKMPGLNGMETLKKLRNQQNYTSVIFISGEDDLPVVTEALTLGADDYIRKPYYMDELVARIKVRFRIKDLHDQLSQSNERLKELSEKDSLTGLFNMRSIYQKIAEHFKQHDAVGDQSLALACLMIDMDHFKKVNDLYDHIFGSYVLKDMGKIILRSLQASDIGARYGGDEFLILLVNRTPEEIRDWCHQLRKEICGHIFTHGPHKMNLTISQGLCLYRHGLKITPIEFVRMADHALYHAKDRGRNQLVEMILSSNAPPSPISQAASTLHSK